MTHHEITREQAEEYRTQVEQGFNQRNVALIERLMGPHLIDHNILLGGADIRQRIAIVQEALEDAEFRIEEYIFEGNAIAWRWSVRGKHTQTIMNVPATGKDVVFRGLSAGVFKDGKLVSHWEFSDDASLLAQLEAATSEGAD